MRLYPADGQGSVDPDQLARLIGPRTRAVYLIHYFGFLQPHAAAIRALCAAHGLRLIEDCALSLLSGEKGRDGLPVAGMAGDVALLCFYKFFPVLAGGALVVNAPDLPDPAPFARPAPWRPALRHVLRSGAVRLLGPGGFSVLRKRRGGGGEAAVQAPADGLPDMPGHYYFDPDLADRGMSGLTARALAKVDVAAEIAARRAGYLRYLAALEGFAPLFPHLTEGTVPLGMPLQVAPGQRDALVRGLQAEGIAATPWWSGYHRGLDFSGQAEACRLKDGIVFLPLGAGIGPAEIDRAAALLQKLGQGLRVGPG